MRKILLRMLARLGAGTVVVLILSLGPAKAEQRPEVTQAGPQYFWGAPSNSLRAGIFCESGEIQIKLKTGRHTTQDALTITNVSTNVVAFYWPPRVFRDDFVLKDAQGRSVPKTKLGQQHGRVPEGKVHVLKWNAKGYSPFQLAAHGDASYDYTADPEESALNLGKYFILTNAGTYSLTRYTRICTPGTNGILRVIVLPPVTAAVRVMDE